MRWIIGLSVAAALWALWWMAAGYGIRSALDMWLAAQRDRGWQAEATDIGTSGFPARHVTRMTGVALADPGTGAAWQIPALEIDSRALWPGHVTLRFADAPQRLSYFDRTVTLAARDMAADLRLIPGLALELDRMALASGAWSVTAEDGPLAAADTFGMSMQQRDDPAVYDLEIAAEGFSPGSRLREAGRISEVLPAAFETLALRMQVRFDKPWDRSALERSRPQPRQITLALADAHWGPLRLRAAGDVTVDAEGVPDGTLTIKADNWREMLAMLERAGAAPPQALRGAERVLGLLSGLGRDPDALEAQLNIRSGYVALGPFPLGPAPRLILR